jgi:lysine-specific demethylase/histidyl-hydroxylase NO66
MTRTTPIRPIPTPATTPTRSTRSSAASAQALERCIEPIGAAEFRAGYWESRPLLVQRDEPGRYDDLLSEREVERLVCETGLRFPAFRLVKEGAKLDVGDYTVDLPWRPVPFARSADVERVLAEFEAGATIVIQGLHLNRAETAVFCRALEGALGHPVQANAYYTPRGSQGLAVHHDTHDVFVLQIGGEKRWLVYEPVLDLPLKEQRYSAELGGPGEPVIDTVLRPGDTLYLPRGWLHEARTSEVDSLHLTVGINVYTWLDAFHDALRDVEGELAFRRSIDGDESAPAELLELLGERLSSPDAVRRRKGARLERRRRPVLDGQLRQLRALDRLTTSSEVERRPTALAALEADGDTLALSFHGKRLLLPARLAAEAAFVVEADGPFTPADLPGSLDEPGRLVLVRRLVREGLLRLRDPDEPAAP